MTVHSDGERRALEWLDSRVVVRRMNASHNRQSDHATAEIVETPLTLGDGTRTSYAACGDGNGTPLLFLHGLGDSWRSFERILPRLPLQTRAFAPTIRGHGDGDRPRVGYRPADLAGDVVSLLNRAGVDRAIVIGHSLGAWIATRVAVAHPERVAGVVLVGAFATPSANPAIAEVVAWADALSDPIPPALIEDFQRGTAVQPVAPDFMEMAIAESLKVPAHVWQAAIRAFHESDHLDGLASITAPALLIWGDRDPLVPRSDQMALAAAIPSCELRVYEGTGHAVHWEQSDRFAADVVAFARGVTV